MAELKGLLANYSKYEMEFDSIDRSGSIDRSNEWSSRIYKQKLRPKKLKAKRTNVAEHVTERLSGLEAVSETMAPLPKNIFKREEFVIFQIHDSECYVIRCQLGNFKKAMHDLIYSFPDAVKILHLSPEANARSLYIRLKEHCYGTGINFHYNNVDLGENSVEDFLQTVLDVRAEKFVILKLADLMTN